MKDLHFSVRPSAGAKVQALDVIKQLRETIPIERAKMRLRLTLPRKDAKRVRDAVAAAHVAVEAEEWLGDDALEVVGVVDPGNYRAVEDLVRAETKGKGTLEILTVTATEDAM